MDFKGGEEKSATLQHPTESLEAFLVGHLHRPVVWAEESAL